MCVNVLSMVICGCGIAWRAWADCTLMVAIWPFSKSNGCLRVTGGDGIDGACAFLQYKW